MISAMLLFTRLVANLETTAVEFSNGFRGKKILVRMRKKEDSFFEHLRHNLYNANFLKRSSGENMAENATATEKIKRK